MTVRVVHSKANLVNGCSTFVLGNCCPCVAKCIYTIRLFMWNMETFLAYLTDSAINVGTKTVAIGHTFVEIEKIRRGCLIKILVEYRL